MASAQPAPSWWPWPERHRDTINNWTDAFSFLDLIPGPAFLLVYMAYAAAVVGLLLVVKRALRELLEPEFPFRDVNRVPFQYKPTFLEVAYLRAGKNAVIEAAVCNLHRIGILTASVGRPRAKSDRGTRGETSTLTRLELAICTALETFLHPGKLRQDALVRVEVNRLVENAAPKLQMLGVAPTRTSVLISAGCCMAGVILIAGLALVRIIRSELRGYHNVELLGLLAFFGAVSAIIVLFPNTSSRAGWQYLRQLRTHYLQTLRRIQSKVADYRDPETMYAIATFGAAKFSGTSYRDVYEQLKPPSEQSSSCGGCGGGSCGGGGCGGGGCGGGGCGGG